MNKIFWFAILFAKLMAGSLNVALISPEGAEFEDFRQGLQDAIPDGKFFFLDVQNSGSVLKKLNEENWDLIVALDNPALRIIEEYQVGKNVDSLPQVFAAMALQLDNYVGKVKKLNGVRYEIPPFTTFSHLRALSKTDFNKVLVYYRKDFLHFLDKARYQLKKEKISLLEICVDCKGESETSMRRALVKDLKNQKRKENFDLLWVLTDNVLLSPSLIQDFWRPKVIKENVPVIVPISAWVSPRIDFGIYHAGPDHAELGSQLGDMILNFDENREGYEPVIEDLISVKTTINLEKMKKVDWNIDTQKLNTVHKVYR